MREREERGKTVKGTTKRRESLRERESQREGKTVLKTEECH